MTFPAPFISVERVCTLPYEICAGSVTVNPAIQSIMLQVGSFWAIGQNVLLRSQDGVNWQNLVANLKHDGSFYISSVIQLDSDLRIFARNKNGLNCYRWEEWKQVWKTLFPMTSSTPGVFSAWTVEGLILVAKENPLTEIVCRESNISDLPRWSTTLPGNAVHLQLSSSGIGLCALWGTAENSTNFDSRPSAIYSTDDSG
jgi:hypothetical protein